MKTKILIVDDEPLARDIIKKYLESISEIEIVGECADGFECLKAVSELKPDLLFLDVQMPKLSGFELLEVMDDKPEIIFATAFDQYAMQAFDQNAVDYLLKPFSKERFLQALSKAQLRISQRSTDGKNQLKKLEQYEENKTQFDERIIVKKGSAVHVIPVAKILYLEADGDYVLIHTAEGKFMKEKTMKYYESHLTPTHFIRIHRSYIVNIDQVEKVELFELDTHLVVLKNGSKIRASREGYKKMREFFQ
ncbi:MAG: response regulator [Bacteroidota bacterium]